jgi:hypothetical protein
VKGYIREETPGELARSLRQRWHGLANAHARQYGVENLDGLLLSVYLQGVRDAAETLERSGAIIRWPDKPEPGSSPHSQPALTPQPLEQCGSRP